MQCLLSNKANDPEGSGQWCIDPGMDSWVISGKAFLPGAEICRAMVTVLLDGVIFHVLTYIKTIYKTNLTHNLHREQEDQKKVKILAGPSKGYTNEG